MMTREENVAIFEAVREEIESAIRQYEKATVPGNFYFLQCSSRGANQIYELRPLLWTRSQVKGILKRFRRLFCGCLLSGTSR